MLSSGGSISTAQAAFFAILILPLLYVLVKHGKHGLLGWFFLISFAMLRLIGGAMLVSAENKGTTSSTAALISQIGLSPLSFAMAGLAHEASQTVKHKSHFVLSWPLQVIIHFVASTALALVIVGALNGIKPGQTTDQTMAAVNLTRAGAAMFLIVLALIVAQLAISFRQPRTLLTEKHLLYAVCAVMPAFALRALFLFIGAMVNSRSWGVLSGAPLAAEIVMEVIPEFLLTIVLAAAGIWTRNLPKDRRPLTVAHDLEMTNQRLAYKS